MRVTVEQEKIAGIKAFYSCTEIFRQFWPDFYNERGNSRCPFHDDSTPSMQISKDFAFCHACGGHRLDVIDLYHKGTGKTVSESINDLALKAGKKKLTNYNNNALSIEDCFRLRGIPERYLNVLESEGYISRDNCKDGYFKARLVNSSGNESGYQFIEYSKIKGGEKKFSSGTNAKESLFHIPGAGTKVVVEGVFDAISIKVAIPNADVWAVLSSNFAGSDKLACINECPVIFFDNDESGIRASSKANDVLKGACRFVDWSVIGDLNAKDPNDLLSKGKLDLISHLVENSKTASCVIEEMEDPEEQGDEYLPMPPSFPIGVFPQVIRNVINELSDAFDVPPDVAACSILSFAGACIGRTRGIKLKKNWVEHPNLFLALVGESGIGKSPVNEFIKSIIVQFESAWREEYEKEMETFQSDLKEYKQQVKDGDNRQSLPVKPEQRQLLIEDATIEAVGVVLETNPRGLLWVRDELFGLIVDLDKYSGKEGSGRSRLLSAHGGSMWKTTRKDSSKNSFVEKALISIFGTIQEKLLPDVFRQSDTDSGFTPRFLMCRIVRHSPPKWTDAEVSDESINILKSIIETFLSWTLNDQNDSYIVRISEPAMAIYKKWYDKQAAEPWNNPDAKDDKSILAKSRSYAARLALILHCLESAVKDDGDNSALNDVSERSMIGGITLTECFTEHQRQIKRFYLGPRNINKNFDTLQQRAIKAIISLEGEIDQGMLSTAKIREQLNKNQIENMWINPTKVGKILSSLGLQSRHMPDKKSRGVVINTKDLLNFKSFLGQKNKKFSYSFKIEDELEQEAHDFYLAQEKYDSIFDEAAHNSVSCSSCARWERSNQSYGICTNTEAKQGKFKEPSERCDFHEPLNKKEVLGHCGLEETVS